MVAVIYARYSDSKQDYNSIIGQLQVCHKYGEANGYTVLREYIDEAQSGKTDDRVQFRKMLADSKKKQFDAVIVYTLDRFGRNLLQALNNERSLQENGVTILSATEHTENTPSGRMQRNIHMTFAQYFSDELSQKVSRGHRVNAEEGLSNGPKPLGYKVVNKRFVIEETEAAIVQEIFTRYANGWRIIDIVDDLNQRQLKSGKGQPFKKNSMSTMLNNRRYLGIYIYGDIVTPGGMPQIISEDLFNKVQERMRLNKLAPARARAKAECILTTKLFCGYCKTMMIGHSTTKASKSGKVYNYYTCKNSGGSKPCKKKKVGKDTIEDTVVDECRRLLTPKNIRRIAKEVAKIAQSYDDTAEIKRLEGLIQEAQTAIANQMVSLHACTVDTVRELIIQDLSALGAEQKALEGQLELEKERRHIITEEQIIGELTKLADGDVNDLAYRKSLIRLLVNKIYLYDDRYTITFNSGDGEVAITGELLAKIEAGLEGKSLCLSNHREYQSPITTRVFCLCGYFFAHFAAKSHRRRLFPNSLLDNTDISYYNDHT